MRRCVNPVGLSGAATSNPDKPPTKFQRRSCCDIFRTIQAAKQFYFHSLPQHPFLLHSRLDQATSMLRQALSTSSRALRAAPRLPAAARFSRPQFQTTPSFSLRALQPSASRWYSESKEQPAEGQASEKTEAKEGNGEADPLAELKQSLEAKDAEARDWKVWLHLASTAPCASRLAWH